MKPRFCKKCLLLTFVALVALATGYLASTGFTSGSPSREELQGQLAQATLLPDGFRSIPAIELRDHNNTGIDAGFFHNRWTLAFFGYTSCPDICPVSMSVLSEARKHIQAAGEPATPQVVFVSVDPDRDLPDTLKAYVEFFDADAVGVTGDRDNIDRLTKALGIVYKLADDATSNPAYLVDHSASFVLIDPTGSLTAILSAPHDAETIARDYLKIVKARS